MNGSVRRRDSGRWQARIFDAVSGRQVSLGTFATKADAKAALRGAVVDQERGQWVSPDRGRVKLGEYAAAWIEGNQRIGSPRTRERYRSVLRMHIAPQLGDQPLNRVTPSMVRSWYAERLAATSPATTAKAYRVLRAVFNTAVRDELVIRNPCKIEAGGVERSEERPIATVAEIEDLVAAAPDRYKALVLMAAWTSLRFGELAALTRADVNLLKGTVSVTKNLQRLDDGTLVTLPPKSAAGRRTVAIPAPLKDVLADHLERFALPGPDGLVFVGERGAALERSHWSARWRKIREAAGRPDLRFHDLRHTGNVLAAATGASTKQLMARMGHSSMVAALRYQHATEDGDQAIADALGQLMKAPVVPLRPAAPDQSTG
jgi:integrase